jgi:hypothetical protein
LYALLGNKDTVAWLTPHAFVARCGEKVVASWIQLNGSHHFYFIADGKHIVALARSPEHLLEICNVVLRVLAVSVVHPVTLEKLAFLDGELSNAPTLTYGI